jgi:radical SAM-linked protein
LGPGHRYLARFAKEGPLVLLGHLEMAEVFKRAFRRASIPLRMSRGFHPQPRLVFMTALPVGLPSLDECLYFELSESLPPQILGQSLILPEGLRIITAKRLPSPGPKPKVLAARFEVESGEPALAGPPLHPGALLSYTGTKGPPKEYLLSKFVKDAGPAGPGKIRLTILADPNGTPKLAPVVQALWGLPDGWTGKSRKIATILDTDPAGT